MIKNINKKTVSALICFIIFYIFNISFVQAITIGTTVGKKDTGLNSGLVGWWTMDGKDTPWTSETAGTAIDKSGNGYTGTLTNMNRSYSTVPGKLGQALNFDGVDDFINMGNILNFERTNSFSFTAWIKRNENGSADQIITKMVNSGAFTGYMFAFTSADAIIFYIRNGLSNVAAIGTTAAFSDVNKWYHVAATYDGSSSVGGMKIYVDGVSVAVSTISNSLSASIVNTQPLQLAIRGTTINATSNPLNGFLDDVRIYNRTLSASEIQQLYNMGSATKVTTPVGKKNVGLNSGLVGWWTMDGKNITNGRINDLSGNGNHGNTSGISTSTFYTIGKLGQALNFDGVDDYVSIPNNSIFNTSGNFTTSVWFIAPNENQQGPIVGRRLGVAPYTQWNMLVNGDDCLNGSLGKKICFFIAESYPTTYRSFRTTNEVVDGKWHNVVMVSNRTAGTFKAYVDGVEVSVTTELSSGSYPNPDVAQPFMMGNINSSLYFNGKIDDVRYYNRPLSVSEIQQLYNTGAATKITTPVGKENTGLNSGLVGWWTMDGKNITNGRINDLSGNGNHGNTSGISTSTFYTIGKLGQALNFDGVDDYEKIIDINENLNSLSVFAWVKTTNSPDNGVIIGHYQTTTNNRSWLIQLGNPTWGAATSDFGVVFSSDGTVANTTAKYVSGANLKNGKWQHVGFTWNGTTLLLYQNGISKTVTTYQSNASSFFNSNASISIGAANPDTGGVNFFGGSIDDTRIYNRVLSASEVQQLYNMGK